MKRQRIVESRHVVSGPTQEQDTAAGGRERRLLRLPDGRVARASIELKDFGDANACWAYLRWSDAGKTYNLYVGGVAGLTRSACLANAWRTVHRHDLLARAESLARRVRRTADDQT